MRHSLDPRRIIYCTFAPHTASGTRQVSATDVGLYFVLPLGIGAFGAWAIGVVQEPYLTTVIAVYAILAAVLMSLLPLIYSIVGQADTKRKFTPGERILARNELVRLTTLQDLYAAICYSIFLLVLALFACIALVFLNKLWKDGAILCWLEHICSTAVYFVGASTALSVLNVGNGVFDAMEDQVRVSRELIEGNTQEDEEP